VSKIENLLKNYNKLTNNKGAGRLSPQRDAIVRETHTEHLVRVSLEHDKPDFISGKKTFIAVVVKDLEPEKGPRLGSTAEYVYSNLSVDGTKQFRHCLAMVPDVHDLVTPVPEDMSSQADNTNPKNYIPLTMAAYFYTFKPISEGLKVGAIIEVEFNDNEYDEGTIISVIEPAPVDTLADTEVDQNGDGTNVGDSNNTTGDGMQNDSNGTPSGKCGDGSTTYPYVDCKSAALTSTGQTVTLHPVFWDSLDNLLNKIKENEGGFTIKVGESIRNQDRQLQIRKTRCPQWNGCISEDQLKTERWTNVISKCGCKDTTPVAAVTGAYASNHLKGLAVDFKMDVSPCPANTVSSSQYENCRRNSKIYNLLQKYADPTKVKNLTGSKGEPWHWSHNGK